MESIQNIAKVLQPEVSTNEVVDEWKLLQVDNNLPHYNPSERIEMFWNAVFELHSVDWSMRYKVLPSVIKSALVLAQTNAEFEQHPLVRKLSLVFILSKKLLGSLIQSLIDQK